MSGLLPAAEPPGAQPGSPDAAEPFTTGLNADPVEIAPSPAPRNRFWRTRSFRAVVVPLVVWLLVLAGVILALWQGRQPYQAANDFTIFTEPRTVFEAFDHALAVTGWTDGWRKAVWAMGGLAIVFGLAATGLALMSGDPDLEAPGTTD